MQRAIAKRIANASLENMFLSVSMRVIKLTTKYYLPLLNQVFFSTQTVAHFNAGEKAWARFIKSFLQGIVSLQHAFPHCYAHAPGIPLTLISRITIFRFKSTEKEQRM
jgi:hypothetical protein